MQVESVSSTGDLLHIRCTDRLAFEEDEESVAHVKEKARFELARIFVENIMEKASDPLDVNISDAFSIVRENGFVTFKDVTKADTLPYVSVDVQLDLTKVETHLFNLWRFYLDKCFALMTTKFESEADKLVRFIRISSSIQHIKDVRILSMQTCRNDLRTLRSLVDETKNLLDLNTNLGKELRVHVKAHQGILDPIRSTTNATVSSFLHANGLVLSSVNDATILVDTEVWKNQQYRDGRFDVDATVDVVFTTMSSMDELLRLSTHQTGRATSVLEATKLLQRHLDKSINDALISWINSFSNEHTLIAS